MLAPEKPFQKMKSFPRFQSSQSNVRPACTIWLWSQSATSSRHTACKLNSPPRRSHAPLQKKVKFRLPCERKVNFNIRFVFVPKSGRKKKLKKLIPALLIGLVGKKIFAILPIFLVGLALLAVKALITAKLAFFLAIFLTLSKAVSGIGGGGSGLGLLGKVAGLSAGGAGAGLLGGLSAAAGAGSGSSAGTGSGFSNGGGYSNGGNYANSGSQGWSSGSGGSSYPYARSYDDAQDLAYNAHTQTE